MRLADFHAPNTDEAEAITRELRSDLKLMPELPSIELIHAEGAAGGCLLLCVHNADGSQMKVPYPQSEIDANDPDANDAIHDRLGRVIAASYN